MASDIADGPARRPAFARQIPWRDLISRSYFPFRHTCCDLLSIGEPPRTANRRLLALSSGPATILTSVSLDRGLAIDPASSYRPELIEGEFFMINSSPAAGILDRLSKASSAEDFFRYLASITTLKS